MHKRQKEEKIAAGGARKTTTNGPEMMAKPPRRSCTTAPPATYITVIFLSDGSLFMRFLVWKAQGHTHSQRYPFSVAYVKNKCALAFYASGNILKIAVQRNKMYLHLSVCVRKDLLRFCVRLYAYQ